MVMSQVNTFALQVVMLMPDPVVPKLLKIVVDLVASNRQSAPALPSIYQGLCGSAV
jgi:hypothetical protein